MKPISLFKSAALLLATLWLAGAHSTLNGADSEAGADADSVQVVIEGVRTERGGELLVMLFRRDGFPVQHDRALSVRKLPATSATLRIAVPLTPDGREFAIKVLHDQDRDGRVTKNFIGIPAEGLGFSNGAVLNFGPPKFDRARFRREDAKQLQRIRLQYL